MRNIPIKRNIFERCVCICINNREFLYQNVQRSVPKKTGKRKSENIEYSQYLFICYFMSENTEKREKSEEFDYKLIFSTLGKKIIEDGKNLLGRAKEMFGEDAQKISEKIKKASRTMSQKVSEKISEKNISLFPENSAKALGPYSPALDTGSFVFFSGQIALDSNGEFLNDSLESECEQVFKNIDVLLQAAECKKENIVKTTIFLDDLENFSEFNTLYAEYFGNHKPARSCVQVGLPKNARVEIEVLVKR